MNGIVLQNTWKLIPEGIEIGTFSGTPSYIPGYGQSPFVLNTDKTFTII